MSTWLDLFVLLPFSPPKLYVPVLWACQLSWNTFIQRCGRLHASSRQFIRQIKQSLLWFCFWLGVNWLSAALPGVPLLFAIATLCLSASAGDVAAGCGAAAGQADCSGIPADFWPQAGRRTHERERHREAQPALHQGHERGCQVRSSIWMLRCIWNDTGIVSDGLAVKNLSCASLSLPINHKPVRSQDRTADSWWSSAQWSFLKHKYTNSLILIPLSSLGKSEGVHFIFILISGCPLLLWICSGAAMTEFLISPTSKLVFRNFFLTENSPDLLFFFVTYLDWSVLLFN